MNSQIAINDITEAIIGSAIEIHRKLGPGLLESAYKQCLVYSLSKRGLTIEIEKAIPLVYEEVKLECGYRADIIAEQRVIIEVKSVDALADIHTAQMLTYLRLSGCKIGLLMNFNVTVMKDGIKRLIV